MATDETNNIENTAINDGTPQAAPAEKKDTSDGAMDLLERAYGYKPVSIEDRQKEQKRRRQQEIASSISDALQAMSNLFFASKGAPNMYDSSKSQTKQLRERWEKADKEERESAKGYLDGYLKILGQRRKQEIDRNNRERQSYNLDYEGNIFTVPKHYVNDDFVMQASFFLPKEVYEHYGLSLDSNGVTNIDLDKFDKDKLWEACMMFGRYSPEFQQWLRVAIEDD